MDVSTPEWASSVNAADGAAAADDDAGVPPSQSAAAMEMTDGASPPSSQRTSTHRLYRCFKFVTVAWALLLLIAQIVSVVFLPFDGVELALKFFVSSFSVLVVLNELECWKALRGSPLFWNFVPRGYFYAFIGLVSTEENNLKPTLDALPAALFIEAASWAIVVVGMIYFLFGLCCGQRYINMLRDDHSNRLAERKKMFEEGVQSDAALSRQMIA